MTKPASDVPPYDWGLSQEGLHAAMELGDSLPMTVQTIMSSAQSRAVQTARAISSAHSEAPDVVIDETLDEVVHPAGWDPNDQQSVRRYLEGESIEGWESHGSAVARLDRALLNAQRDGMRASVLVTHGVLLSLWIAPRIGTQPLTVWRGLGTPDVWRYDVRANRVERALR